MVNWHAYFNRNGAGCNNGQYSPVCEGDEQTSTLIAHLEPEGSTACSTDSVTELECLEAVRLLLPDGRSELFALHISAAAPVGCSMNMVNWHGYFNRGSTGSNTGAYSPVCSGHAMINTVEAHLETQGSNACSTTGISEAECL